LDSGTTQTIETSAATNLISSTASAVEAVNQSSVSSAMAAGNFSSRTTSVGQLKLKEHQQLQI